MNPYSASLRDHANNRKRITSPDFSASGLTKREEFAARNFATLVAVMPRNIEQAAYLAVLGADKLIEFLNKESLDE